MITHPFWGNVAEDWQRVAAERPADLPGFGAPIPVFLGDELLEEDEQYDPTPAQLSEYAATFRAFVAEWPRLLPDLQANAFARYRQLYAHYHEDPAKSGAPALGLTTAEQHFAYMQSVSYLRVSDGQTLRLVIHYDLDTEHGLEVRFVANELVALGGIAETSPIMEPTSPASYWTAVANVVDERPYGPGGLETRRGTKHFRPGAKVYIIDWFPGMCDAVVVVGYHRKSGQLLTLTVQINTLRQFRAKVCYAPPVLKKIEAYFADKGGSHWLTREFAEQLCATLPTWQTSRPNSL